ncbi:MAG: hypothetical protein EOO99_02730 [Pedobacter sp.]|nr:MAG: hypothetical protein EOO99_02730 [Pedobacter sp.]
MEKLNIHIKVKAPVKAAWEFYTNPESIQVWNQASSDWCCPFAENDLRVGGKFNHRMESKDGKFGFDFNGEYTTIIKYKSIAYNLSDGREVIVDFIPNKSDTETAIFVNFDPEKVNPIEFQKEGWQAILNSFKFHLEKSHK